MRRLQRAIRAAMSSLDDLTLTAAGDLLSSGGLTATELLERVLAEGARTEASVHAYACVLERKRGWPQRRPTKS